MKRALILSSFAAVALLVPVLYSVRAQDNPPDRPNPRRAGPGPIRPGGQGDAGRNGDDRGGPLERRQVLRQKAADLGLTDLQKADIRKAVENSRRERLRKSTDMKIATMDLRSLLRAEKVDEKAVAAKLAEVQAAEGALLKGRVDTVLAMKRILTPEQQKKMGEMRGEGAMGRAQKRMQMRRSFGRGQGRMGRPGPGGDGDDSEFDELLDGDGQGVLR
jgi:Spy/CpxP family protein refolding chaperone